MKISILYGSIALKLAMGFAVLNLTSCSTTVSETVETSAQKTASTLSASGATGVAPGKVFDLSHWKLG